MRCSKSNTDKRELCTAYQVKQHSIEIISTHNTLFENGSNDNILSKLLRKAHIISLTIARLHPIIFDKIFI